MSNSVVFSIDNADTARVMANVLAALDRGDTITIVPAGSEAAAEPAGKPFVGVTQGRRVEIPHGTILCKTYYDTDLDAFVDNGKIVWKGQTFDSLTGAALASGRSVNSKCNAPNGYWWWKVEEPEGSGKWTLVAHSRFTEPFKK